MTETYEIEFEEYLVNGITSYKCSICSELFNNKQLLADHHYSTHVRHIAEANLQKLAERSRNNIEELEKH